MHKKFKEDEEEKKRKKYEKQSKKKINMKEYIREENGLINGNENGSKNKTDIEEESTKKGNNLDKTLDIVSDDRMD